MGLEERITGPANGLYIAVIIREYGARGTTRIVVER